MDGRVVWVRREAGEHQTFVRRLTNSLGRCSRKAMADSSERCWVVNFEADVFLPGVRHTRRAARLASSNEPT